MKQAVILAAGEGSRLRPFTVNKPKAMIYIAGKPIIRYVIESLAGVGIREIILIAGHKREQIFDYVGDGSQFGVEVRYISQDKQLGTADALMKARGVTDSEFLVLPGDKLIAPETLARIVQSQPLSILVKRGDNPSRYGVVFVDRGRITGIYEKPSFPLSNLINTGIYIFNNDIFDYIGSKLDIPDVINEMLDEEKPVSIVETDQPWLDVVYPWDILSLNSEILRNISAEQGGTIEDGVYLKGKVAIGQGTIVRAGTCISGPVVIGEGCEIGPHVCIFPATSIGAGVVINSFTEIRNSVLGDGVHIRSGSTIQDTVVDKGCVIGSHFCAVSEEADVKVDSEHHTVKLGAMIGEGCDIKSNVIAQPGVIIGNNCRINPQKVVSGRLADKGLVM